MFGFVYLIQNVETQSYKIGITTKENINERLKNIQTGSPGELILLKKYKSKFFRKIEKYFHNKYCSQKIYGEWFKLNEEQVLNFINDCYLCEKTFLSIEENPFFTI